jgi:hypothetical protein
MPVKTEKTNSSKKTGTEPDLALPPLPLNFGLRLRIPALLVFIHTFLLLSSFTHANPLRFYAQFFAAVFHC